MTESLIKNKYDINLKGKDFLSLAELSSDEILFLIDEAIKLKQMQKNGEQHPFLKGKVLGMIFEKSSTRTRVSFEVGMYQLGGHAIFLSKGISNLGEVKRISRYCKSFISICRWIMIRTFAIQLLKNLLNIHRSCH